MKVSCNPITAEFREELYANILELLKQNDRKKQAGEVFEMSAYVDMLENKLDQMTHELVEMRKELREMKEEQASKTLKETLSEMVDRAEKRCDEMKQKLFEVKEDMKAPVDVAPVKKDEKRRCTCSLLGVNVRKC